MNDSFFGDFEFCILFWPKNAPFQREAYAKKESKVFCQNTLQMMDLIQKRYFFKSAFWSFLEDKTGRKWTI